MHTLSNPASREQLVNRIQLLAPLSHRQWGTMTVEEMLWHLRSQLELALGIEKQTTQMKSVLSLPPLRWLTIYVVPWPKGSPTAPEMNVKKSNPAVKNIEVEKQLLLQRLEEAAAAASLGPHPLFGAMDKSMWSRLIWKHIDHHLRQFGV